MFELSEGLADVVVGAVLWDEQAKEVGVPVIDLQVLKGKALALL
ncbi:hypothetical protein [Pseudomonas sp. xss_2]